MKRFRLLFLLLAVLGLVAAACGDDDDTEAGGETTDEAATDEAATEEPATDDGAATEEPATKEPAAPADCAVESLALKTPGQLTVATGEAVFPPWVLNDDPTGGEGFEAALVYALAEQMGFTPEQVTWTGTSFDDAVSAAPKDYDFNIQQYSITPERDEVVDFSDGYYAVEQALIGVEGSTVVGAASLADLKDKRLGAALGTTSLTYIEEVIQPDTAASAYDDNAAVKSAFDAGQIDGAVFDLPTAYFVTAVEIEGSSIVGVLPQVGAEPEELGMLFEDGSELVPCVNAALGALRDAGTLDALQEEWLNQGGSIPTLTE